MDTVEILNELALVAWENAEAEQHEKRAASLRTNALRRVGKIHAEMKHWQEAIIAAREAKSGITQEQPATATR